PVEEAMRLRGASDAAQALAWGREGELAAAYPNNAIAVWTRELAKDPSLGRLAAAAEQLAFTREGLVALSDGDRIRLFDPAHPEQATLLDPQSSARARGFAFDESHDLLFVSYEGGEISRWNLTARQVTESLPIADPTAALGLSLHPDGAILATTGGDQ